MEGKRGCKIRKRGCSSSSSSSLVRKNRFKRAILVGKRAAGGATPIKSATAEKSPGFAVSPDKLQMEFQSSSLSARKLAATLWEIGNSVNPQGNSKGYCLRGKQPARNRRKVVKSSQNFPPNLSGSIFGLHSDRMDRPSGDLIRRTSTVSQKMQVIDYKTGGVNSMETRREGKCNVRLKDVSESLTTSKEIVKVLTRVRGDGDHDQQTPSRRLISALRCELDRARSILNHLIKEHRASNERDIQCLMECFAEEKSEWRRRERERIREAVTNVSGEIAVERKLRKQTERLNKKLGRELADAKVLLSRVMKELESERRAKEILEQVCDELVRGVGEDKAEVEKLRREAERAREDIEKEREMMQIADVLREERVQMKLSEAKYQFEEKNTAVEKLKSELEDYLRAKMDREDESRSPGLERIKTILEKYTRGQDGDGEGDGSDRDSDLQSIELNMDSASKSYKWSYVESGKISGRNCRKVRRKDASIVSTDDARKSIENSDDSVEKRSLIVDFQIPDSNTDKVREHIEDPDGSVGKNPAARDRDEIDRDKSIKNLRDYIMSNVRFVSPSRQWSRSLPCPDLIT